MVRRTVYHRKPSYLESTLALSNWTLRTPHGRPPHLTTRSSGSSPSEAAYVAARSSSRGDVRLEHVVHHHPVGAESPAERPDGALHARDPFARQAVTIAIVVERHNLLAQDLHQVAPLTQIVDGRGRVRIAAADGEAVEPVVGLRPPSVQDRQVQRAVEHHLLPARPARLERPPRVVQPHVHTLDEIAADADVVVLDEDDLAGKSRIARKSGHLLQDGLPRTI